MAHFSIKSIFVSIALETNDRLYRKMCQTKKPLKREELVTKLKHTGNIAILSLTRKSKANHFNNFFQENKLNLFKTWEGIRKIINITAKGRKKLTASKLAIKL